METANLGDALRRLQAALAKAEAFLHAAALEHRDHALRGVLQHDVELMRVELAHLRREYAVQLAAMLRC